MKITWCEMRRKMKVSAFSTIVLLVYVDFVHSQINSIPGAGRTNFYLDRYSDCDGRPREVGRSTVFISGTSTEFQGQPVTSCSITLNTENIREPYRFKLQILEVRIDDPGVYFYIYDGEFQGKLLRAFNKQDGKPSDLNFIFTSGQLVTFRFTRGELDRNYDIRVVVEPVPSGTIDCSYSGEHNCDEYGYNYRLLGTKEIAGIIAGCFALVFVIVIVVVCCCYRKQRGISQKWKEEKLGHVNTAASVHSLNGKVSHSQGPNSTKPWTSESSKHGFASIRRSPNLPRAKIARSHRTMASDSSMFDSNASLPVKRPLPPPHINANPRGTSDRSGRRYRDKYDRYHEEDDRSSDRSFSTATKNFSERNYVPPTYREAMRHESESSADEHTFVGADDSRQQSVFIEKVMMPSANANKKTSPKVLRAQRALPPPEQDEEYDSIEPKKKSKPLLVDKGAGSEEETDESDTENESEEESSEEETESEAESEKRAKDDKPDAVYSQPNKVKNKPGNEPEVPPAPQPVGFRPPASSQPQQFQGQSYPGFLPPGVHQPQPRYGYPGQQQPYPQGQPQYPQGQPQYPQGQPQYPQGQPSYPQGQPQFPQGHLPQVQQPNPSQPNSYHQANFTVPLQQPGAQPGPQYPNQTQPQPHKNRDHRNQTHKSNRDPKGQVPPSNPPVYSYLVNRGYKPVDGRYSPVSTSTGASNLSGDRNFLNEDSDFSANLGSGVELMKRKK